MMEPPISLETLVSLIRSDLVTPQTRAALSARLENQTVTIPVFFNEAQFGTLREVCDRLIPQPEPGPHVDLPGLLDTHLAAGTGKGWRYAVLPDDATLFKRGMDGIEQTSYEMYKKPFPKLLQHQQDEVLRVIQSGGIGDGVWKDISAPHFFTELLAMLVEIYYSHPVAKAIIGDVSFADAAGWQLTGMNDQKPPDKSGQ